MINPVEVVVVDQHCNPIDWPLYGLIPAQTWIATTGTSRRYVLIVQVDVSAPQQVLPFPLQQRLQAM